MSESELEHGPHPMQPRDTLHVESEVVEITPSKIQAKLLLHQQLHPDVILLNRPLPRQRWRIDSIHEARFSYDRRYGSVDPD